MYSLDYFPWRYLLGEKSGNDGADGKLENKALDQERHPEHEAPHRPLGGQNRRFGFRIVMVRNPEEHFVELAGFLPGGDHLDYHTGEYSRVL